MDAGLERQFEIALDQRADLLRPDVIGVVIARRQHIGADHDPATDLLAEPGRPGFLVHVGDILAGHAQAVADAVIAGEVRRRLCRRDNVVGRQRVMRVRQGDLDDLGPGRAQPVGTAVPQRLDLGRHAVDPVFLRNANLHALDRASNGRLVVGNGEIGRGRVLGVVAGHGPQQDGVVPDRAGNRPGLVQRRRKGDDAPARTAAIGWLDPDRAGEGRRLSDRPASIRGRRTQAQTGRNSCRRTAGRAARHQRGVRALAPPRRCDGTEGRGLVRRAHGKLVIVELAQHHRAIAPELGGHRRLIGRDEITENRRAGRRPDTGRGVQILDAQRQAFKRTGLAAGQPRVGSRRHGESLVRRLEHIGVQRPSRLHGLQERASQLGGRQGSRLQGVACLGQGQVGRMGHQLRLSVLHPGAAAAEGGPYSTTLGTRKK